VLPPQHRLSDAQNWRAVELVLEGAVFLVMGLELKALVADVQDDHVGIGSAVAIAAGALSLTVAVRAVYVVPLLAGLRRRARRGEQMKPVLTRMAERLADPDARESDFRRGGPGRGRPPSANRLERARARVRRTAADIDHFLAQPLDWRDGTVVVWAGMRGAVTLAAAQTLPDDAPSRSLLVLVAFLVAAASLLLQGSTLPLLVRALRPARADAAVEDDERARLAALLADASGGPAFPMDRQQSDERKATMLTVIAAQRQALLDARDDGLFGAEALTNALAVLDADQISLELKGGPA
jgi:CPA1 family monovalent cation:H+ antiporter